MYENNDYIKMDYSLESPDERVALVNKIIENTPPNRLTPYYLTKMSDYIVYAMDKQEKKEKRIITENRLQTIKDNELSWEGLCQKFDNAEGGESTSNVDGIYNLITNDKNIIKKPKNPITEEEIKNSEYLTQLREDIKTTEELEKAASGRRRLLLRKQLIQQRQDQYVIRDSASYKSASKAVKGFYKLDLSEKITFSDDEEPISNCIINFFDERSIEMILNNYSGLVQDAYEEFLSDTKWLMADFDNLAERALEAEPALELILLYKIDGRQNEEIKDLLKQELNIDYSIVYISSLWRNKIPKMIAKQAKEDYLNWYYTEQEKGKYKRCSCCGEVKLAHKYYFSKNNTSKDGFYSICKNCRSKKRKSEV